MAELTATDATADPCCALEQRASCRDLIGRQRRCHRCGLELSRVNVPG